MPNTLCSIINVFKLFQLSSFTTTVLNSFKTTEIDLYAQQPTGISWDGSNTLHCDNQVDKLFQLSSFTTTVLNSFKTTGVDSNATMPRGIGWDGSNTLFCDDRTNKLFQLSSFTTTVLNSLKTTDVDSNATYPTDIAWDGSNALFCDADADKLYQLSSFTTTVLNSFESTEIESGAVTPIGIGWNGTNNNTLYCDWTSKKLYKLSSFTTTVLNSLKSSDFDPNSTPTDLDNQPIPTQVTTYLYTGSTPTGSSVSTLRLNTQDNNNDNVIKIPSSGSNYSFWKHIALYVPEWGEDYTQISNVKFYCDGSIGWTGCTLKCAEVTNYDQATGTVGETGDEASANHTDSPTMVNVENYTQSSPLSLSGSLSYPNTGKVINGYVLLQLEVTSSASPGLTPTETLTWVFDVT